VDFYAHSKENVEPMYWQPLEEHLNNVAKLAVSFSEIFKAGNWAEILGVNHDFGKGTFWLPTPVFCTHALFLSGRCGLSGY